MAFNKITTAASGLCLGYAFCHVFIYQFVFGTVLGPLGFSVGDRLRSNLSPEESLGLLLLSLVLYKASSINAKVFQTSRYIGIGAWVGVGLFG